MADRSRHNRARGMALPVILLLVLLLMPGCAVSSNPAEGGGDTGTGPDLTPPAEGLTRTGPPLAGEDDYPWHTDIVATTFWVGEIHDPSAPDGSQVLSAYDSFWLESYGGCDGLVEADGTCSTEPRTAANGFMPLNMTPLQNPFYLDVPFDDLNNPRAFAMRGEVVPWAAEPGYAGREEDRTFSYMKNRWVRIRMGDNVCYGQIQDAGPVVYDDVEYVFGADDARPANTEYNGAGMDVSPALNGCLGFRTLNGATDRVEWQFVEESNVPPGPWTQIITTTPVRQAPAATADSTE